MDSELLYQTVRIAFTLSLLLFLVIVTRTMLKELRALESGSAGARSKTPPATLYVLEPGDAQHQIGEEISLRKRQTVGRSPKSSLTLADPSVSGHHAILEPDGGRWHVQDLRSTNGTFVNGDQVIGITALESGDVIQFGRVEVHFMC